MLSCLISHLILSLYVTIFLDTVLPQVTAIVRFSFKCSLEQGFSNLSERGNYLESSLKELLGPTPTGADFVGLERGLTMCISSKFTGY